MIDYFENNSLSTCALKWRMGKLLVKPVDEVEQVNLPAVHSKQWLVECLKHSSVNLVCIDPKLGGKEVLFWADACEQAGKPIYLKLPANQKHKGRLNWFFGFFDYFFNLIFASFLIIVLSPVMMLLAFLITNSSNQVFVREWRIDKRGRLFRVIKFNTKALKTSSIPNFQKPNQDYGKYTLNLIVYDVFAYLPQLFNVLRGDMTLIETVPYRFFTSLMIKRQKQQRLNNLPHIFKDCLLNEVKFQQVNLNILNS
ncbi:heterocyst development glycosyltransferase HepC [Mastigocoleus testarum]|nr:heterocyst development glycosyltransferase HepC [Mastigocoleus testarum]